MDNHSTHPELNQDLWLETELSSEPDRNQVYDISNTTTENIQTCHSVLTDSSSHSGSSSQSPVVQMILYKNRLRLKRPDLLLRWTGLMLRWLKLGDYTWSYCQISVVHVVHLAHPVSVRICFYLYFLLLLQLFSSE
jgi:hypothetical protein